MQEMIDALLNVEAAYYYISYQALAFLVEALILLWIGKKIKDMVTSYNIDKELTHTDNKALAVSYVGYLVGQAIIILGVMSGPANDFVNDLIGVAIWSLIGIILLNVSQVLNDKFILRQFSNVKEIIGDRNVGVGAAQAGSYIGTAMVLQAVVSGDQPNLTASLIGAAIFFVLGQIAFMIFGFIYGKVTDYDLHAEMERDNIAAGVSFGMSLVAVGIIISKTINYTVSLPAFGAWFLTGTALIFITRFLVDRLLLPNHKLDDEIAQDQNWGVALVEGGSAVMVAFLLNASFA